MRGVHFDQKTILNKGFPLHPVYIFPKRCYEMSERERKKEKRERNIKFIDRKEARWTKRC